MSQKSEDKFSNYRGDGVIARNVGADAFVRHAEHSEA